MSAPTPDHDRNHPLLVDYVYGELEAAPRGEFERHLATCPECQTTLRAFQGTRRVMAELKPEPEPAAGLDSLLSYASRSASRSRPMPRPTWLRWAFALVPTVAIGAAALWVVPGVFHSAAVSPAAEHESAVGTEVISPHVEVAKTLAEAPALAPPAPPVADSLGRREVRAEAASPTSAAPVVAATPPLELERKAEEAGALGSLKGMGGAKAKLASSPAKKESKPTRESLMGGAAAGPPGYAGGVGGASTRSAAIADEMAGASNVGSLSPSEYGQPQAGQRLADHREGLGTYGKAQGAARDLSKAGEAEEQLDRPASHAAQPSSYRALAKQAEPPAAPKVAQKDDEGPPAADDRKALQAPLAQAAPAPAGPPAYPASPPADKPEAAFEKAPKPSTSQQANPWDAAAAASAAGDHRSAADGYRRIYEANPDSPDAPRALAMECQEEKLAGLTTRSEQSCSLLASRFPGSPYASQVATRRAKASDPPASEAAPATAPAAVDQARDVAK